MVEDASHTNQTMERKMKSNVCDDFMEPKRSQITTNADLASMSTHLYGHSE